MSVSDAPCEILNYVYSASSQELSRSKHELPIRRFPSIRVDMPQRPPTGTCSMEFKKLTDAQGPDLEFVLSRALVKSEVL